MIKTILTLTGLAILITLATIGIISLTNYVQRKINDYKDLKALINFIKEREVKK